MKAHTALVTATVLMMMAGCFGPAEKRDDPQDGQDTVRIDSSLGESDQDSLYGEWGSVFRKIAPTSIVDNPVKLISRDWMLITAGEPHSCNTMTASWGALGEMWSYPAAFITVRNTRYTHQFLENNDYFTLTFFHDDYRAALNLLGSRSGREGDKIAESGLTPMQTPVGSTSFEQARMIIECRKLFSGPLDPKYITDEDIIKDLYADTPKERHTLFIGEIVNVWVRNSNSSARD